MSERWECICKYSEHCMPLRQQCQCKLRFSGIYDKPEECEFYKLIEEKESEVS
jgi:hypothetical protein